MMAALEAVRDSLATITGVSSCKIGREQGISPNDFPLIRLVPERIFPAKPYNARNATTLVLFGVPITEAEPAEGADPGGLQEVYQDAFELETAILAKLRALSIVDDGVESRYIETITDSDQLGMTEFLPYKMMAVRVDLKTEG